VRKFVVALSKRLASDTILFLADQKTAPPEISAMIEAVEPRASDGAGTPWYLKITRGPVTEQLAVAHTGHLIEELVVDRVIETTRVRTGEAPPPDARPAS